MNTIEKSPTPATYHELQFAYDWFNTQMFNGLLPNCLITLQRKSNAMGYYSPQRWANAKGEKTDEIALNPAYFANHSLKELLQTLVHEMCHQWQQHYGKPSRNGYHNQQWAQKMESLGLMPSSTGEPGGAKVGQHMGDYAISGGFFENLAAELVKKHFTLPWVDRLIAFRPSSQDRHELADEISADSTTKLLDLCIVDLLPELDVISESDPKLQLSIQKRKTTYKCKGCNSKVWGKPNLAIACIDCNKVYQEV